MSSVRQSAVHPLQRVMPTEADEPVNIKRQLQILWRERVLIAVLTVICTAAATVAAFVLPKQYKAEVVLSPVLDRAEGGRMGALSGLASEFGGVAELAGLSTSVDTQRAEVTAMLESELLTERYIAENHLLPVLYKGKWDAARGRWKVTDPKKIPTLWKANRYFARNVRKLTNKTGLVTLTITWKDPALAAKWANDLVKLTNDYLRAKAIGESERDIAYLNSEAAKTNVVEAREAIYSLMRTEIDKEMLARGSEEYAFRILDPAVVPEQPSSPQKLLWILGGFGGGLVLAVSLAFLRAAWKEST